jgi:hypothetical protein
MGWMFETMLWIAGIGISSDERSEIVIPDSNRRIPSCTFLSGSRTGHSSLWSHSIGSSCSVKHWVKIKNPASPAMLRIAEGW